MMDNNVCAAWPVNLAQETPTFSILGSKLRFPMWIADEELIVLALAVGLFLCLLSMLMGVLAFRKDRSQRSELIEDQQISHMKSDTTTRFVRERTTYDVVGNVTQRILVGVSKLASTTP